MIFKRSPRPSAGIQGADDFWQESKGQVPLLARNIFWEYAAICVNGGLGLVMLPFNVAHLGQSAYGLWLLTTSVTTYFSILDLGYGSAQLKFAAQYRALRDAQGINEIASTLFSLFLGVAVVAYALAAVLAFNLHWIFNLTPEQALTGRNILLIVSVYVALGFPFSVFGGLVNGFQRYYWNNVIGIGTSIVVAIVNVVVLLLGYGIVELVMATTLVRVLSFAAYCRTAYWAFPPLTLSWRLVRVARLKEVTSFSAYLFVIDIAGKINFSADTLVIGAFIGTAAIAIWAVALRLVDVPWMLSRVLTHFLFPTVVDSATRNELDRLRSVLLQGTRLSAAAVIPMASVLALLAGPLVSGWVGPRFEESVPIVWILAAVVATKICTSTGTSILRGAGQHRFVAACAVTLAVTNLLLSAVLVQIYGLVGVAFGTLIPVALVSFLVLMPAACRRVELPVSTLLTQGLWPALWPAIPTAAAVMAVRGVIGTHVAVMLITAVAAGLTYLALFLYLALDAPERRWYLDRVWAVLRRPRGLMPA